MRFRTIPILILSTLALVGCLADPDLETDEAALASPPPVAPPTTNIGGGGDCDTPDEAETPRCGGGGGTGGAEPDATFCELYPSWCPPPPRNPLPPRTPCSLLDPCPPDPVAPEGPVASIDNGGDFCRLYPRWCDTTPAPTPIPPPPSSPNPSMPPVAPEPTDAETRAAAINVWAYEVGSAEAMLAADEAWLLAEEGIVAPCPPNMPPSYCDGDGGGGTGGGTGGGGTGGGGTGGGGGGTPTGWVCPAGWRFMARYGQCVYRGQPCNDMCDVATEGTCTINVNYICECSGGTGC